MSFRNSHIRTCLLALFLFGGATAAHAQFAIEPTEAKRREDADIFLSGAMVTARNATPIYQWDIKVAYPKYKGTVFFASPLVDFVANKGTDANPDKAKLAAQLGWAIPTSTPNWNLIPEVQVISETGGEFDREFATKSFVQSTFARVLFRTFFTSMPGERFAPLFDAGIDLGDNRSNKLSPAGSGRVTRLYGATSLYKELGSPKVVLVANYQYRAPLHAEIFTHKVRSQTTLTLTRKPRHFVEIGIDYGLSPYFAFKPKYRWGALPPAYNQLDHQLSVSFEIKAQVKQ